MKRKFKKKVFTELDCKIVGIPCEKDTIPKNQAMKDGVIASHPFSQVISGTVGGGKSTLVLSLFTKPDLYKDYFHTVIYISPTCHTDSLVKQMELPPENCIADINEEILDSILTKQRSIVETKGEKWTGENHRTCLIFDDIVSSPIVGSRAMKKLFTQNRHYHLSVILLTQTWRMMKIYCRMQCQSLIFFGAARAEIIRLADDLCPNNMSKNDFMDLIADATRGGYNFLHILMTQPMKTRYRENFLKVYPLGDDEDEDEDEEK
jgi:hypothetical protein